ncbi:hypothetical protein BGZ63DRAFT_428786 [Mariannaea sp. PMI_226]|nr:hypothetical protein BGZ63DRAFT_428786 [Mariannaea sp. PMI_226]
MDSSNNALTMRRLHVYILLGLSVLRSAIACSTNTIFNATYYDKYASCALSCLACNDTDYSYNFAHKCDYESGECCTSKYHAAINETWSCVTTACTTKASKDAFKEFETYCSTVGHNLKLEDVPEGYNSTAGTGGGFEGGFRIAIIVIACIMVLPFVIAGILAFGGCTVCSIFEICKLVFQAFSKVFCYTCRMASSWYEGRGYFSRMPKNLALSSYDFKGSTGSSQDSHQPPLLSCSRGLIKVQTGQDATLSRQPSMGEIQFSSQSELALVSGDLGGSADSSESSHRPPFRPDSRPLIDFLRGMVTLKEAETLVNPVIDHHYCLVVPVRPGSGDYVMD